MKNLAMDNGKNENGFKGLNKSKKAALIIFVALIITFYVLSFQFLYQQN